MPVTIARSDTIQPTFGDHIIPTTIARLGRGTSRDTIFCLAIVGIIWRQNIPTLVTRLDTSRDTIRRLAWRSGGNVTSHYPYHHC